MALKVTCNVCGREWEAVKSQVPETLCTLCCEDCDVLLRRFPQRCAAPSEAVLLSAVTCSGCRVVLERISTGRIALDTKPTTAAAHQQRQQHYFALTNCGHKRALSIAEELAAAHDSGKLAETQRCVESDAENATLLAAAAGGCVPWRETLHNALVLRGFGRKIAEADAADAPDLLKRAYSENPLEGYKWTVFEYTDRCAYRCHHCYNAHGAAQPNTTCEKDPALLCKVADTALDMGVDVFWLIGGEVIQFGTGWLDLARHIASRRGEPRVGCGRPSPAIVEVVTSGWFLDKENFVAAGRRYADAQELLKDLHANGVSHVAFSLDAPTAELHDENREQPGLFNRILSSGFELTREAGMQARVSVLVREENRTQPAFLEFLAKTAGLMYDDWHSSPATQIPLEAALLRVFSDPTNLLVPFIDVGAGATHKCDPEKRGFTLDRILKESLTRCKAFFRPSPWITVKSSGVLSLCRVLSGTDEGFGNVHGHESFAELLNALQTRFLCQAHARGAICDYARFVDPQIFGHSFEHRCAARAVVSLVALRMHERNVQEGDTDEIKRINQEVAAISGYLPDW